MRKTFFFRFVTFYSIISLFLQSLLPFFAVLPRTISAQEVTPIGVITPTPEATLAPTSEPTTVPTIVLIPTTEPTSVPTITPTAIPSPWTFEKVELNKEYIAPQNSGVKLTFTKLPSPAGNIKIAEITLTAEQIKQTGSLSDKAYDITSDMKDGEFIYNLSLPIPEESKGKAVAVKFSEELSSISTAKEVENTLTSTDTSVSVRKLDHFTIFVVVNPTPGGDLCVSAGATDGTGCYSTIQDAINAANTGYEITVKNGTYILPSTLQINKEVTIIGESQADTIINATGVGAGYGISISASNVTLKNFTINPNSASGGGYPIHVSNTPNLVSNLTLENITIDGSYRTAFDIHGVTGGSLKNLTAKNSSHGNGLSLTGSDTITVEGYTSSGNVWGGIALYNSKYTSPQRATYNITLKGNTFSISESIEIYEENEYGLTIAGITTEGYDFKVTNDTYRGPGSENFVHYKKNITDASSYALELLTNPSVIANTASIIKQISTGDYYVVNGLKIQEAINAANSGDTINVAAGTYIEAGQIVISKDLTITGADKNTTIIKPSTNTTGNNVDSAAWFLVNTGVTFNLNNVTLDGDAPTRTINWAIASYGHGTIDNNIIKNIKGGTYLGRGIVIFGDNTTVSNNTFNNIERIGVHVRGAYSGSAVGNATVTGNTYTCKGTGDFLDYGVEVGAGATATISNNNITNCRGVASDNSTSAGILVTDYYGTGTTATITGNTITNSTEGISVGYDASDISVVVAHSNNLSGNATGVNSTNPTVDATNNWWGDMSGPGSVGTGVGDSVSANVSFSPWCLTSACSTYSSIYSNSTGVNLGTSQDVTVGDLTLENVTGTGSLFVAKYNTVPSTGGLSTGVDGFYYDIQATGIDFPVSITLNYSDTLGAPNYLDENHFTSLYYYQGGSWHDYKLDVPASTVSIDKTANKITATLRHLTPIVPVIDTTAPTVPDLTAPTNNGYVVTNNFDFTWNDSTDASTITYEYQASLNPASTGGILTTGLWHSGILPTAMIHSSGASDGKWYWQVRAIDSVGNTSAWSAIWNVTIDTTTPVTPTHISPVNGAFKTTASLTSVDWSDVTDTNGPVSYYYQSSLSSATKPDGSFVTPAYTSGVLANSNISAGGTPQNTYYWHVRAKDVAGNLSAWSSTWSIIVDNTVPSSDPSGFSSSPTISTLSNDQTITVSWTAGGTDALSGVDGYSYNFTTGATDVPDNIKDIEETITNVISSTLADGTWYFHIRTVDNAGNWTSTAHYGPFTIETVLPTLSSVSIVSNNSNPIYAKTGDIVTLTFTSSETVNTPTVTILGQTATVSNLGGNNWQATYITTGIESEGIVPLAIDFTDIAGNNGVQVIATTNASAVTYDNTNPTDPGAPSTTTPTNSTTQNWNWSTAADTISGLLQYAWRVSGGPSGTVLGTSTTATTNLLEGIWNFFVKAIDNAGNESAESEGTVTVDTTPPNAPTPITPGDVTAIKGVAFDQTWTNESSSGAIQYGYQSCNVNPGDAGGTCGSIKSSSTYSGTTKHVNAGQPNSHFWWRVRAKDAAGNWSNFGPAFELIIDNSAPNISLNTPTSPTNDTTPSFTGTSSDVYDAGVNLVEYKIDSGSWLSATGTNSFSFTTDILAPGTYTISARATDYAGNISTVVSQSITIDITAPSISADNDSSSWRNSNITITLSVSDSGGAGLKTAKYNWDSPATASVGTDFIDGNTITIPSDGSHILYLYADDNADNSNTFSGTYKLDTTDPTTVDSGIDTDWHNTDVTVTLTCSDGSGSGCANTYYTTDGSAPSTSSLTANPFTLTSDGNYTIKYFSIDTAGNVESVKTSVNSVNIDKTDPSSTITTPTNPGTNSTIYVSSWSGSIRGEATDILSGVNGVKISIQNASGHYFDGASFIDSGTEILRPTTYTAGEWEYSELTEPLEGSYTIKSHAIDNATNMESTYSLTIILDKTIPEVSLSINPTVGDAQNGWYKTQPEVTLTATDDILTDIIEYQWDSKTGTWTTYSTPFKPSTEGAHVLYYRAHDLANNYSEVGIKNIKWNKTDLKEGPLNVNVSPNPTSESTSKVKWDAATSDTIGIDKYEVKWSLKNGDKNYTVSVGSGVREYTVDNLTEGIWEVKVTAFDASGNSKSASADLTVDRTGPSVPTLSILGTGPGTVSLSWSKIDGANNYIIWYGTTPGTYQYGAKVGDTQSYTVQGLGAGSYYFIVKAVDPSGNQSGSSNEVSTGAIAGAPGVAENTPAQGFAEEVLGTNTLTPTPSPTGSVLGAEKNGKKAPWWPWLLLLLLPTGWFGYKKWRKGN